MTLPGATLEQVEAACLDRSATEAVRYLRERGLLTSESRCNVVIGRMIADGRRERKPSTEFGGEVSRAQPSPDANVLACKRLLARQLQTGAHWISDPERMRSALIEAGLAA